MQRGEIAPEEQFLLSSTMFCYLVLDFYVKTRIRFSLRDKRLFEITEVEIITRVDCSCVYVSVRLPILILSVYVSVHLCVRPSARPPVCIFLCDIVSLSVCIFSFSSFIRPIVRTSYRFLSV